MRTVILALALVLVFVPAALADPGDCNAVVSMSQGRGVYNGERFSDGISELEIQTGEQWMALIKSGKVLSQWTDPALWNSLSSFDRCGSDAEIDHVVFLFDPFGSGVTGDDGSTMREHLQQVLAITASRYPSAVTSLVMLVGGVGHVTCFIGFGLHGLEPVRASVTHAERIGQLTLPEAGADLDVSCDQYSDTIGHLTDAGSANAQSQLGSWFNSQDFTMNGVDG